ncbi:MULTISPECIES: RNA degradosome polyphosphate kinase [Dietzia]|uniref:Polyphosphate kinase n=1 Tax=Dietzia maris TaxID=37915 RepID=A0ABT8GWB4_9ACTN|nr:MULTISPECIES: RNA degradosome polyphosphate kinase [Dietzia]MBB0990532.1 RNA degradosome polyphosphate kinase [Dietzia sp. SLG510A3-30A2]MBB0992956.1 RNA degradosome polyphosphate kinase [Dietzia sp. SLG510A3-40A3]MBB1008507.1 RNA degradosome polyphosphate kinase [Dietzia sp. SLG510A3-3B2-2]HBD22469.1 RNA degradosome polyphosphate kinase [Dietzia sp.]MBB0998204.1 RNA degradosome polyphosphate kinase [Dietzia maris]
MTAEPTALQGLPRPRDRYLNRELSWLDFNARVLALAGEKDLPLLERAKFLAIFASNLDEFYMVRVAGLQRRDKTGLSVRSADGQTPAEQLGRISRRTRELCDEQTRLFEDEIRPALEEHGIRILPWADLTAEERFTLAELFRNSIFPVLTPLAVDPAHPFPYISGLSLNLAVIIRDLDSGQEHFARVKIPHNVPRFVRVDRGGPDEYAFVPAEDIIAAHLQDLFQGMEVVEHHVFRVTRNADMEVEEDRDEDLLQALERELARRRFGSAVRLEIAEDTTPRMLRILQRELDVDSADVIRFSGLLDLTGLWQIHGLDLPDLKDPPMVPATPPAFGERETARNIFASLQEGDVLVEHPYESFATTVQRFIEQAAADDDVLAIKQTLYRTSGDSPIVNALVDAAAAGKQVVALVEIKARFDEQNNIRWARELEQAGVHVVYGLLGLKTHCKTCLVVRKEGDRLQRYAHIGTGNYNPKTARLYEDVGLFTADEDVVSDLTDLFNHLTGFSNVSKYRRLLVAPEGIRSGIVERIDREIELAAEGREAGIRLKANALVDEQVIDALYRASQAGVPVDIVVRGICSLRAGVPGLSENIHVRSILGRFLEHSRILHFRGADEALIGSADMMHRNLDRRVEVMVTVTDPRLKAQIHRIFDSALDPATRSFHLRHDASWARMPAPEDWAESVDHQERSASLHAGFRDR